jgi:hypothetical protein
MESQYPCGSSGMFRREPNSRGRVDQGAQRRIHHGIDETRTALFMMVDPLRLIHPTRPSSISDE